MALRGTTEDEGRDEANGLLEPGVAVSGVLESCAVLATGELSQGHLVASS